jgi:uncharacterized protein
MAVWPKSSGDYCPDALELSSRPTAIQLHSELGFTTTLLTLGKPMRTASLTVVLLILSNVFMTFAWYAHLKNLGDRPWIIAALVSWGIALFEYLLQVPANRIGYTMMSVGQLKILQEVITLSVFAPFAVYYLKEPLKLDYLWAALCMLGAVYFMFRSKLGIA